MTRTLRLTRFVESAEHHASSHAYDAEAATAKRGSMRFAASRGEMQRRLAFAW
jgi:hypothetical protein